VKKGAPCSHLAACLAHVYAKDLLMLPGQRLFPTFDARWQLDRGAARIAKLQVGGHHSCNLPPPPHSQSMHVQALMYIYKGRAPRSCPSSLSAAAILDEKSPTTVVILIVARLLLLLQVGLLVLGRQIRWRLVHPFLQTSVWGRSR
jgi:hypothetical protein